MRDVVVAQLLDCLRDDLAAVREHQHILKRCDGLPDDLGAYHRFSGCGRRHDDDALDASRALAVEFGDGFGLVIAELSHRRPCRSRGKRIPALAPEAIVAMTLRGPSSGSAHQAVGMRRGD